MEWSNAIMASLLYMCYVSQLSHCFADFFNDKSDEDYFLKVQCGF